MINPKTVDIFRLPSIPLLLAATLPSTRAVYFCTSSDKILYIGLTQNLQRRWLQHHKTIQLINYENVQIHWLELNSQQATSHQESQFIEYHNPVLNRARASHINHSVPDNVLLLSHQGIDRLRQVFNDYPSNLAGNLYLFFAKHLDKKYNAAIASQDLLAQEMGVTTRTIYTVTKWLEQQGAILRLKISGTVYAYCLNPDEVSKSWRSAKKYAAFNTKTLISVSENPGITKRIQIMLKDDKVTLHQQDAPESESKPSKRRPPVKQ